MATSPRLVKAGLAALLEAEPSFAGVTVFTYTEKTDERVTRDHLTLGNVNGTSEPHGMGGPQLSNYTIECESSVNQPAPDDAADRAWLILGTIADVLSTEWTVDGVVIDAQLQTFQIDEAVFDGGGRRVDIEFTIEVRDE